MSADAPPIPDQVDGAPHPRETRSLIAQGDAESAFLQSFQVGRLHHAWLLSGPKGIGKATLAYRIARFLLSTPPMEEDGLFGAPEPPQSLDTPADHPVVARISAGSEPGLRTVTRGLNDQGRLRAAIGVDEIRKLAEFFQLSAADGGHRVVIIDAADEMNTAAANALLKMLEEPPKATTLLLVAHQPSRLLPTIRSRCRSLRLSPLPPQDLADALQQAGAPADAQTADVLELAAGSVGGALRLINLSGHSLYEELITLMGSMPQMDRARARALADGCAARGQETRLDLLIELIELALARLARSGALGRALPDAAPREAETFARLCPNAHAARHWATRAADITDRLRHGRAVNLDPAALVLDTLIKLNDTASDISSPISSTSSA